VAIPNGAVSLMRKIYKDVFPIVHTNLGEWKKRAEAIPNEELRKQALLSIESKTFHCEGGGIYGILAQEKLAEHIKFVVAYQTISDYLDNLCDRSTSLDPVDFRHLHCSMLHALSPNMRAENYYKFREDQNDGGYLQALVETCQDVLRRLPHYEKIAPALHELAAYYCDLQVHKHVTKEERVERLRNWFNKHEDTLPPMSWYEFSACTGSTLGIFCLVAYAFRDEFTNDEINKVQRGLFPYVQGLHILLDYFIDQEEDKRGGDLNFCFYYEDERKMVERLQHFYHQANERIKGLPDESFHQMINKGLIGIYLSDSKVRQQRDVHSQAKEIIRSGGMTSKFFYYNARLYRKLKEKA
jgi:tetraprenyl-beta-curcumene synthase